MVRSRPFLNIPNYCDFDCIRKINYNILVKAFGEPNETTAIWWKILDIENNNDLLGYIWYDEILDEKTNSFTLDIEEATEFMFKGLCTFPQQTIDYKYRETILNKVISIIKEKAELNYNPIIGDNIYIFFTLVRVKSIKRVKIIR
jgi:hypothetical protein